MTTQKTIISDETINKLQSSQNEQNTESNQDVYFLILIPSDEKIDFGNLKFTSKISPMIIFKKIIEKENGTFLEEIVFKFKKKKETETKEEKEKTKGEKEYMIKFIEGDNIYIISFEVKKESFIYLPELKRGNIYLDKISDKELINQNIIPLYNKLNIFIEALEENDENNKKTKLYEDTIELYEKKKKFNLLISLFLKLYEKNKDLCNRLIEIFNKINEEENKDREKDLKKDLVSFNSIYSKAEDIVNVNKYNPIYFYGILFSYLHYYDKEHFPKMIEKLWEGNAGNLYEILIQYYSHFMHPLNQSQKFYDGFIKYTLKKEKNLKIFKRVLNYVEDIETFLFIINENKEDIFNQYDKLKSEPIEIKVSLKLVKYMRHNTKKVNEKSDNESDSSDEDDIRELYGIENECETIIKLIEKIIDFSEKEKILAIYIKSAFWKKLIKEYNIPDWENIDNCYNLRKLYKKYNKLVNSLYGEETKGKTSKIKKDDTDNIKKDIKRYYDRDEFAFVLNKNVKDFIELNKNRISNSEILGTVAKFNPYFSINDESDKEKYKNYRETYIFDYINFSRITKAFNQAFKCLNFEIIFEENITDYINKITEKIKDIKTFGNIIELIEIDRINEEKQKYYFKILKEKYKIVIKNDIKLIKGEAELSNAIKIIAELVSKFFLFEKNNSFLDDEISILDDKIKSLVYIELITRNTGKEYEKQKYHIYDIYLDKIDTKEGRDNVIKLVKKLSGNDKEYFLYEKLLEKCEFTKEEFFSNKENYKIKTLCRLNKELIEESQNEIKKKEVKLNILEQAEKGNKYAKNLVNILDSIIADLDKGSISLKDLEKFLNIKRIKKKQKDEEDEIKTAEEKNKNSNKKDDTTIPEGKKEEKKNDIDEKNKEEIIEKLELITLLITNYCPTIKYAEYKATIDKINEEIEKLIFIKDSLMIFHRHLYNQDIQTISNIIEEIENCPIINFRNEDKRDSIKVLFKHMPLCEEINKVKDFLLFKKIFENSQGRTQDKSFDCAIKKLNELKMILDENATNIEIIFNEEQFENIFKDIKEEFGQKDESKSDLFINQMISYFNIKNKTVIEDLKMIIKSKKYEMIIKSIKYFFENFLNKKLILPVKNINLSEMNLNSIKKVLNELKRNNIYDYESTNPYYRVFTSMYEKKEAIDFLISKINVNSKELSNILKDKLSPTNRNISIKDIEDTIKCLNYFKKYIDKDISEIMNDIKLLNEEEIKKFESFSKKYGSIIELDCKIEKDAFEEIYQIINKASLLFNLDNEDFCYEINGKFIKIKDIEELINLKNTINIQPQNKKNEGKKDELNEKKEEKDPFEIKCDKLIFFKDVISNLEIIYDKINILRTKGFNIPIVINISIEYPKVSYKLNEQEKEFNKIKDYLYTIKNDYENQLNTIYQTEKYLRFLYGPWTII